MCFANNCIPGRFTVTELPVNDLVLSLNARLYTKTSSSSTLLYVHRDHSYGLLGTGSPGRPPRLLHSSWALNEAEKPNWHSDPTPRIIQVLTRMEKCPTFPPPSPPYTFRLTCSGATEKRRQCHKGTMRSQWTSLPAGGLRCRYTCNLPECDEKWQGTQGQNFDTEDLFTGIG